MSDRKATDMTPVGAVGAPPDAAGSEPVGDADSLAWHAARISNTATTVAMRRDR
jgi:hypothetical protein